jgi:hypothetical protein
MNLFRCYSNKAGIPGVYRDNPDVGIDERLVSGVF